MGIYTSNRYFGGEVPDYAAQIPANEAYDAAFGCAHILADCQTNDMALFESAIFSDMQEVMAVQEGVQVVNENAFTNVIKKIVEMFKKLLAKIKGIFSAFLAKIAGAFKNGKQLVKQYEKQIIKYSNWKDFKVKGIRKPKNTTNIRSKLAEVFKFTLATNYEIKANVTDNEKMNLLDTGLTKLDTAKAIKDADAEDIKLAMLNKSYISGITISDYKDLETDIKDHIYDDEDTLDGEDNHISGSYFSAEWIKGVLLAEKWESDIKKDSDKMEKLINKIIDDLNKTGDKLATFRVKEKDNKTTGMSQTGHKFTGDNTSDVNKNTDVSSHSFEDHDTNAIEMGKDKERNAAYQEAIQALQTLASNEQEVITKVTSLYMDNIKFATAQARKIWAAAAAWSSTEHKESVEYYQALGEASAEQFYMNIESIGA